MQMVNKLLVLGLMGLVLFGCADKKKGKKDGQSEKTTVNASVDADAEDLKFPVYDFEEFEPLLHMDGDTTYVINFWATWCKPCIGELPHFERVNAEQKEHNVKVILVNLDMPNLWKAKVEPFVETHQIKSEVVILDDPNLNEWLPKVSDKWGGGIPATLIYNKNKRNFFVGPLTYEGLNEMMDEIKM